MTTSNHRSRDLNVMRFGRARTIVIGLAATLALQLLAAGPTLANHSGVTGEVTIYRDQTVVSGYSASVESPGNETIYVNLWGLSKRDYNRIAKCWGGSETQLTILANHYNVIEQCNLSGSWRIQTDANLDGAAMFPTHPNDVLVIMEISMLPSPI